MTHLNFESVFGLDQFEHEQEKARAEEERAREVELKEILTRELPEDLLDDLSDTSSEVSEITEDPMPPSVGLPTHQLRVEGICRSTPSRQQPDSHLDEQFFHSSQILVSTPNVPKQVYGQKEVPISEMAPHGKENLLDSAPSTQVSLSQNEELMGLRILNEARASEIRTLQTQMQQLQTEYELQVSQLSEEVRIQREDISVSSQQAREFQSQAGLSQSQLSDLERKLMKSERQCEALRGENLRMGEELHNALTHLDNCKSQLETLCRSDVIDRLREQHLSMIQQSETDHLVEVREVREEMEAVSHSYQETIRRMDQEIGEQKQTYMHEIERLEGELEANRSLLEELRAEVSESELRARVERLESEIGESRRKECALEDDKRQLELMLEGMRGRCSQAERENGRISSERDDEVRELRDKLSEGESDRKESLEKCRAACLQLHEESCNRLRQKSAQEQRLAKDLYDREKERLAGEVDGLKRELAGKGDSVSVLEAAVREKEELIRGLEGELAVRECALREMEREQEVRRRVDVDVSPQVSGVVEERVEAREVWRYQNELRNQWYEWQSVSDREKRELATSHDIVVKKYQREISHLREHIGNLESELSQAISLQKSQQYLASVTEEREEMYNYTLEAVRNAFREALHSEELTEAILTPIDFPIAEYSPTGVDAGSEFPSLLSDYIRQTLLRVVQPLCTEKREATMSVERISIEQNSKVQQAVTLALQHAKQQYLKSFSDLKASLNVKFSEKIAGLNETWDQERISLSEELDVSKGACQLLKERVRECQQASDVGQKRQVEQLSLLQQKLSETGTDAETWEHERDSLNEELGRGREACQQLMKKLKELKSASEREKQLYSEELSQLKQQLTDREALHQEHISLSEELEGSRDACRQLKKRLRESELASEKDKRRQVEQVSLLKQKLSNVEADADTWHHGRRALNEDLERSSAACLQLKSRLKECELASEKEKMKQMEQLTLLQQKISETEFTYKNSLQALSQKFKKQTKDTRDASIQAYSTDRRYKELFERSLNNLRRETEGLIKKKLAIVEEARRVEYENATKMVENNEHFLSRCQQVLNLGKKQGIQDYHSSM